MSQHRESTLKNSHGSGMMQCSRRCLRKGGCSENGKEREKKTTTRGTGRQKKSKRVVATLAKENAWSQLYDELKGEEGRKRSTS